MMAQIAEKTARTRRATELIASADTARRPETSGDLAWPGLL